MFKTQEGGEINNIITLPENYGQFTNLVKSI